MNEIYTFKPQGVCSREMKIEIDDNDKIVSFEVVGGCPGNLGGIIRLIKGMDINEVADKLSGVDCRGRGTSCPDQLSRGLKSVIEKRKSKINA